MKKELSCVLVLVAGFSSNAFASAGYAYDGLEFLLVFVGFLFLLAGVFKGTDYLKKNGKALTNKMMKFIKKITGRHPLPKPPDVDPDLLLLPL